MSHASAPGDARGVETIDRILSPDELSAFRRGFSNDRMNELARQAVAGTFPAAMAAVDLVGRTYFGGVSERSPAGGSALDGRERERVIIALMTAGPCDTLLLAIHIYWGLMEGLSPDEIAWTQLLTGTYRGIDKFTSGVGVLTVTLRSMRSSLPNTDVDSVLAILAAHVMPLTRSMLSAI